MYPIYWQLLWLSTPSPSDGCRAFCNIPNEHDFPFRLPSAPFSSPAGFGGVAGFRPSLLLRGRWRRDCTLRLLSAFAFARKLSLPPGSRRVGCGSGLFFFLFVFFSFVFFCVFFLGLVLLGDTGHFARMLGRVATPVRRGSAPVTFLRSRRVCASRETRGFDRLRGQR